MEINDTVFRFVFSSKVAGRTMLTYKVYSYNREDMMLFLKQHNFDMRYVHVDVLNITNDNDFNETDLLYPYKFGTNTSDEVFTILTTARILEDAITNTTHELSNTLLFGPPIVRTDIELFRIINDLIHELPHVYILDHTLIDEVTDTMFSPDHSKYIKTFSNDSDYPDPGSDEYIMDSIYNSSIQTEIQPITLEAYVSNFTSMMVDEYN